jgi:glutathione S-transferase
VKLTLVSHALCPYVQRAAIVLHEKGVAFERRWVDLAAKPDWFLAISPLGKTPVLLVDGVPVFESAVICEYLDEVFPPQLHPSDPLQKALQRGWMEFGSALLNTIAAFYNAADAGTLAARHAELRTRFVQLEQVLPAHGPLFAGSTFSMVDAVFAPVFRYFEVFAALGIDGFFDGLPRVQAWRDALANRDSVQRAGHPDHPQLLAEFLVARGSQLSRQVQSRALTGREHPLRATHA